MNPGLHSVHSCTWTGSDRIWCRSYQAHETSMELSRWYETSTYLPRPHLEFARPKACKSCTPHQHLDCIHRPDTWSPSTRIQRCKHCTGCRYPGPSDPCKSCNWNFLQCCRDRLHRWSYWRDDIQSCTSRIGHHLGVNPVAVYKEKSTNKSSQLERRCSKHLKP